MEVFIWLMVACMCGALGAAIASDENKMMGFILGCLLGPIGVIVAAVMK